MRKNALLISAGIIALLLLALVPVSNARPQNSTVRWEEACAMTITKTANPTEVFEPGDLVTFDLQVDNTGAAPLTLTSLTDSIYGDVTSGTNPLINSTTCVVPQSLPVSGSYVCAFTASVLGNPGDVETDTVTAVARTDSGRELVAQDSATVTILNVPSSIQVTKTADPTHVLEPGDDVQFTVIVENSSRVDTVSIHTVIDDRFGDIGTDCDRSLPATLAPGETMTCTFTRFIAGQPGDTHTDTVTASGVDDDGQPVQDDDDAVVTIGNVPSSIQVIKTANPNWMYYPGGDVTFQFTVSNLAKVDSVTIERMIDTVYGDLNGQGDCLVPQVLGVGRSYTCSIVKEVTGEPDTPHTNVVTASGTDDDGQPVSDDDDATVTIAAVPTEVELLYLRASPVGQHVLIEWETVWERDNWGFNLYRSLTPSADDRVFIHFQHGRGAGQFEGQYYSYLDQDTVPGRVYYYWLADVDMAGRATKYYLLTAIVPYRVYLPLVIGH